MEKKPLNLLIGLGGTGRLIPKDGKYSVERDVEKPKGVVVIAIDDESNPLKKKTETE